MSLELSDNTNAKKHKPTKESCNLCLVIAKSTFTRQNTQIFGTFNKFSKIGSKDEILLLRSSSLIDQNYGQKLVQLIKPLQSNKFNYRNSRLIIAPHHPKPKLQTIISQIQHYQQYTNIFPDKNVERPPLQAAPYPSFLFSLRPHKKNTAIPVGSTPAIFSSSKQKFITEINGLLYKDNTELYTVFAQIFSQFLPMFEWCLDVKLTKYEQLSVIIKIQDYQFNNKNTITGKWHCEGNSSDHIIGVGVYYFDITENKTLKFTKNRLEIAERRVSSAAEENIAKINVNHNDCIVFKNATNIQHRAVISAGIKDKSIEKHAMISRKFLTFFVIDPTKKRDAGDLKFINYPWKVDVFVKHFTDYNMNLYNQMPKELIVLIKMFAFGNEKYLQRERVKMELNIDPGKLYADSPDNPFYERIRSDMFFSKN